MKKLIAVFSVVAIICSSAMAQDDPAGGVLISFPSMLSEDELNYCSKGYLADVKIGRDPAKKGLSFSAFTEFTHKSGYSKADVTVIAAKGDECKCTKAFIVLIDNSISYCLPVYPAGMKMANREITKTITQPWHRELVMLAEMSIIELLLNNKIGTAKVDGK